MYKNLENINNELQKAIQDLQDKIVINSENLDAIYEAGKQAEYDAFWDAYQNNGDSFNCLYAFAGQSWTDVTYNPKYPIKAIWNTQNMYAYSQITDTKVDIDISAVETNGGATFMNAQNLKTIRKLIVPNESATLGWASMFNGCAALENIVIEGTILGSYATVDIHWSTKLSHDSIVGIINALSPNASGKTVSFSATAVNNAFEGGSTGSEWLNLIDTKSNWTITLV